MSGAVGDMYATARASARAHASSDARARAVLMERAALATAAGGSVSVLGRVPAAEGPNVGVQGVLAPLDGQEWGLVHAAHLALAARRSPLGEPLVEVVEAFLIGRLAGVAASPGERVEPLSDGEWSRIEGAHRDLVRAPNDAGSPLADVIEAVLAERVAALF